jgi:hypothetical protein
VDEVDEGVDEGGDVEVDEEVDEEVDGKVDKKVDEEVDEEADEGVDEGVDEGADKDVVAVSEDEDAQKEAMEEGELPYYSGFYRCLEFSKDFEARRGKVGTGIERV